MMRAGFLLFALPVVFAQDYEVDITYTCTQENAAGACVAWTQSGKLKQKSVCFPPSSLVKTPSGHKALGDLSIGDEILAVAKDGSVAFSPLRGFATATTV